MIANIIELLGGLGFFLFGMTLLGDGLKRVAGKKLETILAKLTSNTFKGVLLGTVVTAVIQSSSATTVMVVGFVNSGIMQLINAIGIIMGANIGTTATGWVLVLAGVEGSGPISSATVFAFIAFIGIILYFFCKKSTLKNTGMLLLAFSVLMAGMQSMSGAMAPLKESEAFCSFMTAVSNPIICIIIGIVVTAILQSCSASIGILQALAAKVFIGYDVAIPMVVGMCIGACVPVLISAIGANVNGKRAAFVYLYFNLAGAVILLTLYYIVTAFVQFDILNQSATMMGIATVNTVFKVSATLILAPMAGLLKMLAEKTIKDKDDQKVQEQENLLDKRFLKYPSLALEQCKKTMDKMINISFDALKLSTELFVEFNQEKFDEIMKKENVVDKYEDELGGYLVCLNKEALSEQETLDVSKYLSSITNVERISDHAVNLAELAKELKDKKLHFSEQGKGDLKLCIDSACEILEITKKAMQENNIAVAKTVEPLEDVIDVLIKKTKRQHVQRVQAQTCTLELGFVFNECLSNFERVADHCSNIALTVIESIDCSCSVQSHTYFNSIKETDENYRQLLVEYAERYEIELKEI